MDSKERLQLRTPLGDGMILQRDADIPICGWAGPGEKVTVRFFGATHRATAGPDGAWSVVLEKHGAGGPYEMEITGGEKIVLRDVWFGDVWILSGQSNMQLPMERVKDEYPEIMASTENRYIRQFTVPEHYDFNAPCANIQGGKWESAGHDTLPRFSAAGFFFAKQLYETYSVPIGLIQTAIGGASVEAWVNRESLNGYPDELALVDKFNDSRFVEQLTRSDDDREKQWQKKLDRSDEGLQPGRCQWYAEDFDDSGWDAIRIPSYWADKGLKMQNGSIWFRKDFTLPAELAGKPARLFLGRIVDADFAYVNGRLVGTTAYRYPPRKYDVPAGLLKKGKNTVSVRVLSFRGRGGFIEGKPYRLLFGGRMVDLAGEWKYRVGAEAESLPDRTFLHQIPVGLFNGMLSPVSAYSIKGVLWYQGESNTPRPETYEELFVRLIECWRKKFKRNDLPFLYVQLPNYVESEDARAVGKWPLVREAQRKALRVPGTAMVVTIDIGEWNDLHPLNKQDVGKRLALAARKVAYGENITALGPTYEAMECDGNRLILRFSNTGTGLVSKDGKALRNFEIAGNDGVFQKADASVEGDRIILSSAQVGQPTTARYAWRDNPQDINFYNREGLPASPFQT